MSSELVLLLTTAATIGFLHTLFGPDHYLPFIVMSKSGDWSIKKTAMITALCGLGHVVGSVALGFVGIAFGVAVTELIGIESVRGELAAWGLIAFGFVYGVWGLRQAMRNKPHQHEHVHARGFTHSHIHTHHQEHIHVHGAKESMTPWMLFTIFVLGPCEPLIPLLMYPAAKESIGGIALVTGVFGLVTILTMLSVVLLSVRGLQILPMHSLKRYMHALAGGTILLSGLAVQFLGL
jgi:sulfite exporter TauE/SafE